MKQPQYLIELLSFLQASPTSFHAVSTAVQMLGQHGFTQLHEEESWMPLAAGKYFVVRNDSSLIAFTWCAAEKTAFQIIGAHTDSPGLKVKPNPVRPSDRVVFFWGRFWANRLGY